MQCRAAIITFHFARNCGAMLQCYALQTVLEKNGCEASVIDYQPWYHTNRYAPFKNPFTFAAKRRREAPAGTNRNAEMAKGFVRAVLSWGKYKDKKPQDRAAGYFMRKYMHLTGRYRNIEQLRKNPPEADLYIAGSDQIWNIRLTEGFDEAYFLRFGKDGVRRVTYAVGANFDYTRPAGEQLDIGRKLEEMTASMDAISLREEKYSEYVRKAAKGKEIHISLDPTLLLDMAEYEKTEEKPQQVPERFILTYIMPNASANKIIQAAEKLSAETGLPVIDVNAYPLGINKKIADHRVCTASEFLWYVHHADCVLTNSFHGTVFSVIYRKRFAVVPHTETGVRVTELLEKFGLSDCVADSADSAAAAARKDTANEKTLELLAEYRKASLGYLSEQIRAAANG